MGKLVDNSCPDCEAALMWIQPLRNSKGANVGDQFRCGNRLCTSMSHDRWWHRVGEGQITKGKEPAGGTPEGASGRPDYSVSGIP